MRSKWTYMLHMLALPLVALLTMGDICDGGGGSPGDATEEPPDGRSIFNPEYDYMEGYDVFPTGESYAMNAFAPCNTDLIAYFDEVITPAVEIEFDSLYYYMRDHAQIYSDSTFVYKAQLLGMPDALDKPVVHGINPLGVTFFGPFDDRRSAIFVQAIRDLGGDVQSMLEKTVIHELGHARGKLTHLCYYSGGNWYQSPDHNDEACVMGRARISLCTGRDLTANPHFCPACCDRLKRVNW
ncbi:MAG: hypothetical protein AB1744_09025 [Candidatus Zixiibacteriota bacterium]